MANINKWSRTAGTNASIDPDINFAEGQAPSTVNNSCRFEMQGTANDRDDTRGQLSTATSTTAFTLTTNSVNTTLQNGLMVAAKAHATSTGASTLNVDGLGAKKLYRSDTSGYTQIDSGDLLIGGFYSFVYNTALDAAAGGWIVTNWSPAYVVGTWTPGMTFGGSAVGVTFSTQTGAYIKIGNQVFIQGTIVLTNNGAGVGNALITNLPFTAAANTYMVSLGAAGNLSLTGAPHATVNASATTITLAQWGAAGGTNMTDTNIPNTAAFSFAGTYSV